MRIFVTDITEFLICPVRLYLRKIKGVRKENEFMLKGTIVHRTFELFHERERRFWEEVSELDYNLFKREYLFMANQSLLRAIVENEEKIKQLQLNEQELIKELYPHIKQEILFRLDYIWNFVEKYGFDFPDKINPEIESEVLVEYEDLVGRIDRLEKYRSGRLLPVEIKYSSKRRETHLIQLAGYAYLLEQNYGIEVEEGVLLYPKAGRREVVELDGYKEIFLELYEKVKAYLESPRFQRPRNDYCLRCDYKKECPIYNNKKLTEFLL